MVREIHEVHEIPYHCKDSLIFPRIEFRRNEHNMNPPNSPQHSYVYPPAPASPTDTIGEELIDDLTGTRVGPQRYDLLVAMVKGTTLTRIDRASTATHYGNCFFMTSRHRYIQNAG